MADSLKVSGVRLVVEGAGEFESRLKSASSALTQNAAEMKKLEAAYGKNSTSADFLSQKQGILTRQLELQRQRTQTLRDTLAAYQKTQDASPEKIEKLNLAITKSETFEASYERQLRETGDALTDLGVDAQAAVTGIKKTGDEAAKARAKMLTFGEAAIQVGDKMKRMGGTMSRNVTLPIVAGLTYASKEIIQFDDAFSGVVKTFRGSKEELEAIRQEIVELSGSGLVTQSKEEIADVAALASQLGIQTPNIMGFSTAMLQLADATNLSSTEGGKSLAQFANITGMAQKEFSNLGSAIVELGNNSAAQEDAIVSLGMRLAAAGTTVKMSVADIMGISAAFASVGMEAEAGGTAVSKLLLNMDMAVAKSAKETEKYAKVAGMNAKAFQELWKQDSAGGFTAFIQGLQRIQKEGGNVALTLEEVGIQDVRMRDAMLRAVNAGDLLGQSIGRANTAYQENTALAEEAAQKNSTFAAKMKVLKNRFDNAAMSLGTSMMPMLENGMTTLNGLIEGFGNMSEGGRQTVITLGLVTAAIGPVMKVAGNATKAVGLLSKGLGLIGLPGGPVLAAVAGFGALTLALASIKSPLEQVQERMRKLDFKVDEDAAKEFQAGIEKGLAAANKEYEIKAQIKVEMDSLEGDQDAALADGKLTGKERKSLKEQLNTLIKKDIDEAQADLKVSVDNYVTTLQGLKDANGQAIFTDEEVSQFASDMTEKTNGLITQLQTYQDEYDKLTQEIYKQKKPATTQQMAELDKLLAQIATVRAEIKTATDEAIAAAQVQDELTKAGKGTAETAGVSMSLTEQTKTQKLEENQQQLQKDLSAIEQMGLEGERKLEVAGQAIAASEARTDKIVTEASQSHSAALAGMAMQVKDLAQVVETAGDAYDTLKGIEDAFSEEDGLNFDKLAQVLTPEVLGSIGEGFVWNTKSLEQMLSDGDPIGAYIGEMQTILSTKIAEAGESLETENPLTGYLTAMMEKGYVIDPTVADGLLADLLKVLDFGGRGEDFGLDLSKGVGTGMQSEEALAGVGGGGQAVTAKAEEGLAGMPGVGSNTGNALMDSILAAVYGRMHELVAASSAITDALTPTIPNYGNGEVPTYTLPGGGEESGGGGGGGSGPEETGGNVYVNQLNVRKDSDINAIGLELDNSRRRRRAAYG